MTTTKSIDYSNIKIIKKHQSIIRNNITEYIMENIKTDVDGIYKPYFILKQEIGTLINIKVSELMTKEHIGVLNLFDIQTRKIKYCMLTFWLDPLSYEIRDDRYLYNGELSSQQIILNLSDCVIPSSYNIKIFDIIIPYIRKSSEINKKIKLFVKMHYDLFCELSLLRDQYLTRIYKFKKGSTLLKKYPGYKKFLRGVDESKTKSNQDTDSLILQFEKK